MTIAAAIAAEATLPVLFATCDGLQRIIPRRIAVLGLTRLVPQRLVMALSAFLLLTARALERVAKVPTSHLFLELRNLPLACGTLLAPHGPSRLFPPYDRNAFSPMSTNTVPPTTSARSPRSGPSLRPMANATKQHTAVVQQMRIPALTISTD